MSSYTTVLPLLMLLTVFACSEAEKPPPYMIPDDAGVLLAGNSGKTWKLARRFNDGTRMNMGDCFLSYRRTYLPDMADREFHW